MAEEQVSTGILLPGGAREPEVPAGYRRTEAGVTPQGWTFGKLADFGVFRSGSGFPLIYQGLQSGDYPFFKVSDMNNQGNELFMKVANHWIDEETRKKLNAIKHPIGSIAFAKIGAAIFLERKRLLSQESCIDNNMMAFSLTDHRACQQFFYYLFLHLEFGKLVSTTALPSLSGRQIGAISVPIPPSDEQHAITEALSDLDGLLSALDALIAKKRTIKQATIQQLLTRKMRLPGFSGKWQMRKLGDVASFFKGSGLSKSDLSPEGKRRCILYGELFTIYGERITEILHGTNREGTFFYSTSNDVLMPTSDVTPNGLATASCIPFSDVILGSDILVIRIPEYLVNGEFLAHTIKMHYNQVMQLVSGTTVFHLYGRDMANFKFIVPNIKEQRAIVAILSDMDTEITALEQRRNKARALKQGMMQQLLTGRTRLLTPE